MRPFTKFAIAVTALFCVALMLYLNSTLATDVGRAYDAAESRTSSVGGGEELLSPIVSEENDELAPNIREEIEERPEFDSKESIAVHGVVYDSIGKPVPGADVACDSPFKMMITDAFGRFELRVPRGTAKFSVVADHPAYGRQRFAKTVGSRDIEMFISISLPSGSQVGIFVVDPDQNPVAGAEVRLWRIDGTTQGALLAGRSLKKKVGSIAMLKGRQWARVAYTDSLGAATLGGLSDGEYRLYVQAPGWVPLVRTGVVVPLSANINLETVKLVRGLNISGFVKTADGQVLEGAVVRGFFEHSYQETESDVSGAFTLGAFPFGALDGEIAIDGPNGETFSNPDFGASQMSVLQTFVCRKPIRLDIHDLESGEPIQDVVELWLDCGGRKLGGSILGLDYGPDRIANLEGGQCLIEYVPEYVYSVDIEVSGFATKTLVLADLYEPVPTKVFLTRR